MAGVPGSLFGCSDAGDAGWLRIIGHPVTGDMFPPRYDVNGGLGVDVFGVAAGDGVLTLTARAKFEGLIETDGPKEVVRLI